MPESLISIYQSLLNSSPSMTFIYVLFKKCPVFTVLLGALVLEQNQSLRLGFSRIFRSLCISCRSKISLNKHRYLNLHCFDRRVFCDKHFPVKGDKIRQMILQLQFFHWWTCKICGIVGRQLKRRAKNLNNLIFDNVRNLFGSFSFERNWKCTCVHVVTFKNDFYQHSETRPLQMSICHACPGPETIRGVQLLLCNGGALYAPYSFLRFSNMFWVLAQWGGRGETGW